jgi:hypothetical protein
MNVTNEFVCVRVFVRKKNLYFEVECKFEIILGGEGWICS